MNSIGMSGRICGVIDYIYTEKGDLRSSFVIADNAFGDAQFIKCISFDNRVNEKLRNYDKGFLVHVVGKMQVKKYEDKYYTTIHVKDISLLSKKYKPSVPSEPVEEIPVEDIPF